MRNDQSIPIENIKKWKLPQSLYVIPKSEYWEHCLVPLEDEAFSSWFTRISKANCANTLEITKVIEEYDNLSENYDFDRSIQKRTLLRISQYSTIRYSQLKSMCLYKRSAISTSGEWGEFNRLVDGSCFCLICLINDKIPYFRFFWRLKFVIMCYKHNCFLIEGCPVYGVPIKYWLTRWDQQITSCYNCGENLIQFSKSKIAFMKNNRRNTKLFSSLIEIFRTRRFSRSDKSSIDSERFFRQFYKLLWIETAFRYSFDINELLRPTETALKSISLAFEIIEQDSSRLETPFSCSKCEKKYTHIRGLIRHYKTHSGKICPLKGCTRSYFERFNNNLRCLECGTVFTFSGEIIKKGGLPPIICPIYGCKSKPVQDLDDLYYCRRCGSSFTYSIEVFKKGIPPPKVCPNKKCRSKWIERFDQNFKCGDCKSIFTSTGVLLKDEEIMI
ncbi:MAG: TniQ family protein [Candidatus Hodarchaeota archaeon]